MEYFFYNKFYHISAMFNSIKYCINIINYIFNKEG